jgi:hypothetical protein
MRKIRYNIASQKKINLFHLSLFLSGLFLISVLSFLLGANRLFNETRQDRQERQELKILKNKLTDVAQMTADYREKIDTIKRKWNGRVRLSNRLITRKSFSIIAILSLLEEQIPEGVSLNTISMKNESGSGIQLELTSESFQTLMELYRKLTRFRLTILKESVTPKGMARATVLIKMKNEKR